MTPETSGDEQDLQFHLHLQVGEALEVAQAITELWGGGWEPIDNGGMIELPLVSGIRDTWMDAKLTVQADTNGSQVTLTPEPYSWRTRWAALVVLLLGGASGLFLIVVPFFPTLLPLAAFAVVFLILAWFMVLSGLRYRTVPDFVQEFKELAEEAYPKNG